MFSEAEIWYILDRILQALIELKVTVGIHHGDIQPETVCLNSKGEVILDDVGCYIFPSNGYERVLTNFEYQTCSSPEILRAVSRRDSSPVYDKEKADVFSLGMTILSCASNKNFQEFYSNGSLFYDRIEMSLNKLQKLGYTRILIEVIRDMTQENPFNRPTLQELNMFIKLNSDK